ncbi:MAG: hypothetical protein IJO59_01290 [Clostridia bacterium]|nr:hypothetical protein [Clostridia bacterium]
MKLRILAVVLAALLSLSLFAGCKPSDTPDDDTTTTTTTSQADTDPSGDDVTDPSGDDVTDPSGEEETDPSEEETVVTDENGKTQKTTKTTKKVIIGGKKSTTKKVTTTTKKDGTTKKNTATTKKDGQTTPTSAIDLSMPLDETMKWSLYMTEHAYQPIKTDAPKWDALYELTNVEFDIDIGEGASAQTKLMAAAASGKFYDISYLGNTQFRTYKTSLFYDLTDRIKTDTPHYYAMVKDRWNDLMQYSTGGRLYGFAQAEWGGYESAYLGSYLRVDILEDNNIKCPTTWKEWFEAMKVLKKKYPDSQPYASRGLTNILEYWSAQLGQRYNVYYNAEAAKWECGVLNAAKYKNILQFMKDCYDEGILDQNFDQSSDANWMSLSTASKAFFTIDNGPPTFKANQQLQQTKKESGFICISDMKSHLNNNKKSTIYWSESTNYSQMYFIGAQAHHIDELLFFMDWCYTDEGAATNCYGKLGETYKTDKDGNPYVPKSVWQKYADKADYQYQWMSNVGIGQLCFAPAMNIQDWDWEDFEEYSDDSWEATHPWVRDYDKAVAEGYGQNYLPLTPDVEATMVQRFDTIQVYIRNQIVSFIKGNRPMSEYDTFVNDLKAMGIEDLLKACNA